jgi:hypothetical protein
MSYTAVFAASIELPKCGVCRFCGCTEGARCRITRVDNKVFDCGWADNRHTCCSNQPCLQKLEPLVRAYARAKITTLCICERQWKPLSKAFCHLCYARLPWGLQGKLMDPHTWIACKERGPLVKALSLTQPWASLVALGAKRIVTRSWGTSYRGLLAIHASKGFPRDCRELCDEPPFEEILQKFDLTAATLPCGVVLCVTKLVDCLPIRHVNFPQHHSLCEYEAEFGCYGAGRYGLILGPVTVLDDPIPARGALGLWEWTLPEEQGVRS